jgi:flagellar biosynthesis anti-sigma factor FlgM
MKSVKAQPLSSCRLKKHFYAPIIDTRTYRRKAMELNIQAVSSNLVLARSKKLANSEASQVRGGVEPENLPKADSKWTSLMEDLATTPEIDKVHVEKIAQVIQSGQYNLDSTRVAAKLLQAELQIP